MATARSVGIGADLDASLWSELQSFIDLSVIYAKLPLASFFRLRQVCKEWNRLASDRKFLEQNFKPPISSNPYFVLPRPESGHVLLTSEGSSWSSTPVPPVRCEASGLLFEDSDRNRVFDIHTRVFHTLPPLPAVVQAPALLEEEEDDYQDPLTLMTADTNSIPYGFRIIVADEIIGTRIFDSNSGAWTHKLSTHEFCPTAIGTSCVYHNNSLYVRVGDHSHGWRFEVQVYDLERDEWKCEELGSAQLDFWEYSEIGMWQDRLFVLGTNTRKPLRNVLVIEVLTNFEEGWSVYDYMAPDLHEWLRGSEGYLIMNKFCGEYMLMYNCVKGDEKRVVLYNLEEKTWEKIDLCTTSILE